MLDQTSQYGPCQWSDDHIKRCTRQLEQAGTLRRDCSENARTSGSVAPALHPAIRQAPKISHKYAETRMINDGTNAHRWYCCRSAAPSHCQSAPLPTSADTGAPHRPHSTSPPFCPPGTVYNSGEFAVCDTHVLIDSTCRRPLGRSRPPCYRISHSQVRAVTQASTCTISTLMRPHALAEHLAEAHWGASRLGVAGQAVVFCMLLYRMSVGSRWCAPCRCQSPPPSSRPRSRCHRPPQAALPTAMGTVKTNQCKLGKSKTFR